MKVLIPPYNFLHLHRKDAHCQRAANVFSAPVPCERLPEFFGYARHEY